MSTSRHPNQTGKNSSVSTRIVALESSLRSMIFNLNLLTKEGMDFDGWDELVVEDLEDLKYNLKGLRKQWFKMKNV